MTDKSVEISLPKIFIYFGIGIVSIWFLYSVRGILMPFILSGLFAYVLSPLVGYFQSFGFKRVIVVCFLYLIFLVAFLVISIFLFTNVINEVSVLSKNLPVYTESFKTSISAFHEKIEKKFPVIKDMAVFDKTTENMYEYLNKKLSNIPEYLVELISVFSLFVLIPIITFFFLLGGKPAIDSLFQLIPSRYTETILSLISEIDEILGSFLRGQLVESSCVGILSITGLLILGIDYGVLIGLVAGFSNMIPYLGPFIGTIPAVIVCIIKFGSFVMVMKVIVMFAIVQFIDNNFIQPVIFSKGMNLHPLVVIFAVISGAQIAGFMGMFLAVPVASMIKSALTIFVRRFSLIGNK